MRTLCSHDLTVSLSLIFTRRRAVNFTLAKSAKTLSIIAYHTNLYSNKHPNLPQKHPYKTLPSTDFAQTNFVRFD
ncbi:unknown [Prevotella sp. CAG:873]|nr:unknown [Prevotella sp. CAG:873]